MEMKEIKETIDSCKYCFMCRHACPVFLATKLDKNTPKGHALLLAEIEVGKLEWTENVVECFYQCSQCGVCKEDCEYDWPEDELVRSGREEIIRQGKVPSRIENLKESLLTKGTVPKNGKQRFVTPENALTREKPDILYLAGWQTRENHPKIIEAAASLFNSLQVNWCMLENEDSSAMALYDLGFSEEARQKADDLLNAIIKIKPGLVVTGCAHTYHGLKQKYAEMEATKTEIPVQHITEFIEEHLASGNLKLKESVSERKIAFHDPCHLGRKTGVFSPPRVIIEKVTGRKPIELFHSEARAECCGAGSSMFLTDPDLSWKVAARRLQGAIEDGAETLVTACQGCKTAFSNAVESANMDIAIIDITELVASHLQD